MCLAALILLLLLLLSLLFLLPLLLLRVCGVLRCFSCGVFEVLLPCTSALNIYYLPTSVLLFTALCRSLGPLLPGVPRIVYLVQTTRNRIFCVCVCMCAPSLSLARTVIRRRSAFCCGMWRQC